MLAYTGKSLETLHFAGSLNFTDQAMGFMVECPNLVFIDEKPVFLFCPQGLDKKIMNYQNIYPNAYIVADSFDTDSLSLVNPSSLANLDHGFDVYATQAFNAPDGRALAVSWVGLPEIDYPSDSEGWAHCLSLVKELQLKDGQLYQLPVKELIELRQERQSMDGKISQQPLTLAEETTNCYEMHLDFSANSQGKLHLYSDTQQDHSFIIDFDTKMV